MGFSVVSLLFPNPFEDLGECPLTLALTLKTMFHNHLKLDIYTLPYNFLYCILCCICTVWTVNNKDS